MVDDLKKKKRTISCLTLAKQLEKHTEIIEDTFKECGLKILSYHFQPRSDTDADCSLIIELSPMDDKHIKTKKPEKCSDDSSKRQISGIQLKVNLYDKNKEIFIHNERFILPYPPPKYNTFEIILYYNGKALVEAKKAKIFVVAYY